MHSLPSETQFRSQGGPRACFLAPWDPKAPDSQVLAGQWSGFPVRNSGIPAQRALGFTQGHPVAGGEIGKMNQERQPPPPPPESPRAASQHLNRAATVPFFLPLLRSTPDRPSVLAMPSTFFLPPYIPHFLLPSPARHHTSGFRTSRIYEHSLTPRRRPASGTIPPRFSRGQTPPGCPAPLPLIAPRLFRPHWPCPSPPAWASQHRLLASAPPRPVSCDPSTTT